MTTTNGLVAAAGQGGSSPSLPALPLELQVLELFNRANLVVIGPTDCQKHLGVSKGTISGKLKALAAAGYLQETTPGRYRMGDRLFGMGMGYVGHVMRQMDEVESVFRVNIAAFRSGLQQLTDSMPGERSEGQA